MAESVQLERNPPVAWIWLNRPEKLNAIDDDVLLQLREALRKIERDPELGVAVLSGRGRAFSAGGDWHRYVIYIGFVVVFLFFAVLLRDQGFLSANNLLNIFRQTATVTVVAVAMTYV